MAYQLALVQFSKPVELVRAKIIVEREVVTGEEITKEEITLDDELEGDTYDNGLNVILKPGSIPFGDSVDSVAKLSNSVKGDNKVVFLATGNAIKAAWGKIDRTFDASVVKLSGTPVDAALKALDKETELKWSVQNCLNAYIPLLFKNFKDVKMVIH